MRSQNILWIFLLKTYIFNILLSGRSEKFNGTVITINNKQNFPVQQVHVFVEMNTPALLLYKGTVPQSFASHIECKASIGMIEPQTTRLLFLPVIF